MDLETHPVDGWVPCWVARKSQPHLQEKLWRGLWPGCVLSPLLFSLVVVYADEIAVLISRKFPNTISQLLQEALNMVKQ